MLLSMGWRECDRLPPHPQADHRGARRGWECRAKTNGTPRGGPAPAFATAPLSELLWPHNLHNTHCYSRLRDPPTQRAREAMGLVQGGELCRLQRRPVTLGSSEVGADGGSEVDRERQFGLLLEEWTMVVLIRARERGREAGEAVHGAKLMTGGSALDTIQLCLLMKTMEDSDHVGTQIPPSIPPPRAPALLLTHLHRLSLSPCVSR
eukprot:superscaffoldBa00003198_g16366